METFVTVIAILAMIALGVLLIHLVNSRHSDRTAAFHYGRSGTPVAGDSAPDDSTPADGPGGAPGVGQRT
ncbi:MULTISPECIES: hypothetical protein [Streptomyces]|uniref:hypothetical protein n=1 Tax=Streptomyces TaxID=1883 RepID=UPI0015F1A141|nr:hypothetical protein [Streptomyces sp. M7]